MKNQYLERMGGIIKVRLTGPNMEKIINLALARGVYITDIIKSGDSLIFKIRGSAYESLEYIAAEHGYHLEIVSRQGLPFYKAIFKRRLGFIFGAVGFMASLYILSSFIWFVDVVGNEKVSASQILSVAARHGLYSGGAKWNFSRIQAEEAILVDISALTYVKIDIRGVKANIEVVEKVLPPDYVTEACHVVALKGGIIEEILVLAGEANVAPGDVVGTGDILISGIVFPQANPYMTMVLEEDDESLKPYTVRARGTVKARVWYEGYGECKLHNEIESLGERYERVFLKFLGRELKLLGRDYGNESDLEVSQKKYAFNTAWGEIGVYRIISQETELEEIDYTEAQAIKIAGEQALLDLETKIGQKLTLENSGLEVLSSPSDPVIRVKIARETVEDIGGLELIH